MAKKITGENILGQRGINLIEQCVLGMGFAWHPSNQAVEAGIDGYIELRNPDSEEALNLVLAVQSKARSELASESSEAFTFYCEPRDIEYWLQGNLPVILVVSRPDAREAFWVDVKQYFQDAANSQARKIVFDKNRDRLDGAARSRLFAIARPRDSGLYLAPLPKSELLWPNLLKVQLRSDRIWVADTPWREGWQINDLFREAEVRPDSDWIIHGGKIITFQPLDREPWAKACTPDSARERPTSDLADSDDPEDLRLLVRLLSRCLESLCRPLGVRYDRQRKLYHFTATHNLRPKRISFRSAARQSTRTVFEAYRDRETDQVRFCRHLAFEGYFRRLGAEWYLELTPTYHFTRDGRLPDRFASERLKGIKRLDRNRAVFGQLLTWVDILTRPSDLFHKSYPHIALERPGVLPLDAGIDDDAWMRDEDPAEAARLDNDETPVGRLFTL